MATIEIPASRLSCKNCRFWDVQRSEFTNVAECRRHPPVRSETHLPVRLATNPTMTTRERGRGLWPLVDAGDQCGEFVPVP